MITRSQSQNAFTANRAIMSVAVTIATFNEVGNVSRLIARIETAVHSPVIIVIDDCSPDCTADSVRNIKISNGRIVLLENPKRLGLAKSLAAGYRHALATGCDFIVNMDADGAHDAGAIGCLIKAAGTADVVLGSRRVMGGMDGERQVFRRLLTVGAAVYLSSMLRISFKDPTTGYRCYNRYFRLRFSLKASRSTLNVYTRHLFGVPSYLKSLLKCVIALGGAQNFRYRLLSNRY